VDDGCHEIELVVVQSKSEFRFVPDVVRIYNHTYLAAQISEA
jgi:hypothetical protein